MKHKPYYIMKNKSIYWGDKKMKKIIYFILFIVLVIMFILLFQNMDIIQLEKMSYISTIIACVIGGTGIPFAILQIKEIRNDRVLSQKPILCVDSVKIKCCKPEIFRSPDFSEIFIGHRLDIIYNLNNLGDSSALDIDAKCTFKIHDNLDKRAYKKFDLANKMFIKIKKGIILFETCYRNISILKSNDKSEIRSIGCIANEMTKDTFLKSLLKKKRDIERPIIEIVIYYKNLTGGYFKYKTEFEIIASKHKKKVIEFIKVINDLDNKNLKQIKDNIDLLKIGKEEEFFNIFRKNIDEFDEKYKDLTEIELVLNEIPDTLIISNISKEEYIKNKTSMHYGTILDV